MPILVHELIAIELWFEKVYPQLVALDFAAKSTVSPYIVVCTNHSQRPAHFKIYHEATLVSLLEAVMYNKEACGACGDTIIDLVDYVHRRVATLAQRYRVCSSCLVLIS
jgi:hypothetical protein